MNYESILQATIKSLSESQEKELIDFKEEISHIKKWLQKSKEEEIRASIKGTLTLSPVIDHTKRIVCLETFMNESTNLLKLINKQRHSIESKSRENQILYKDIMYKYDSISQVLSDCNPLSYL